ncbi:hypothetical protein HWV62_43670 [Athelia sp. TMB]|nr:hypothetical protein HWV62_43670 [Athelia sp. TMB]
MSRCQELVEEIEVSIEDRLGTLEEKFAKFEDSMEIKMQRLGGSVEDRLGRVEALLEKLVIKLSEPAN